MTYTHESQFSQVSDVTTGLEDTDIRDCQIGGYWAIKSHFTTTESTPATVSIPTGGGKTALMMLLSFGLNADRVLIVSPSRAVRKQTKEKFSNLEGLKKANVISEGSPTPTTHAIDERVTTQQRWTEFEEADVLVTLPNNISTVHNGPSKEDIVTPPSDYFDLVFFR